MNEVENELLDCIATMVFQECGIENGYCESGFMTVYAEAMELLAKYDRMELIHDCGRNIKGTIKWDSKNEKKAPTSKDLS